MNMHVDEKSDSVVVPMKLPNKEGLPSVEVVEGRTLPEGNSDQTAAVRTQSRGCQVERSDSCAQNGTTGGGHEVPDASPSCAVVRSDAITRRRSPVR